MTSAPEPQLSRFEACWLAEAVRLRELAAGQRTPLNRMADTPIAELAPPIVGGEELWLLRRAADISRGNGLLDAALAWRRRAGWLLGVLCGLAVLSGCTAALSFFGAQERAVNVIWTLLGLIGMPVLALLLWLVSSLLNGRVGGGLPGALWLWLMNHVPRVGHRTNHDPNFDPEIAVMHALTTMTHRSGLGRWWLGFITHSLWLLALVACLLTMLLALSLRSYGFVLETTILAPADMATLVQNVGALPARLGFAVPDTDMTAAALSGTLVSDLATQSEAMRRAWSSWLTGGLLVYALLPRLLAWGFAALRLWQLQARLGLDISLPGYAELLGHSGLPYSPGVVDAAPPPSLPAQVAAIHRVRGLRSQGAVLLGLELGRDILWPPARFAAPATDISATEVVESREQRRAVMAQLVAQPPTRLLLACDARLSPDRGTLGWIAEVSHHAGELRVWLVSPDTDAAAVVQEREQIWRSSLGGIGLWSERVMNTESMAYAWLNQHD
ncbi:MAG: DUF2868 domain-containing protein [Pseudomonadota bacterium]